MKRVKENAELTVRMTLGEKWLLTKAAARANSTPERYALRLMLNALDAQRHQDGQA